MSAGNSINTCSEEDLAKLLALWQTYPHTWMRTFLQVEPWIKQRQIMKALVDHDRVSVASGHDLGKSFISAATTLWFLNCFPNSKVITTAPTARQVRIVLWSEIAVLYERLKKQVLNPGLLLQTELRMQNSQGEVVPGHWALGFSAENPDSFQGMHEENLLVIVDEAAGVGYDIFHAIEGIAATAGNKVLLIGNPTNANTYFGHTHSGKVAGWHCLHMSCYDSPNICVGDDGNFQDIDPLPYPKLVSMKWINEKKTQWGENSPQFLSRVLGIFPDSAEDQLIANKFISSGLARGVVLRKIYREMQEGEQIISSEDLRVLMNEN